MIKKVTEATKFESAQEVFDFMVFALAKQGEKSETSPNGSCKYRFGKRKCPAGHLIPDTLYNVGMEGRAWDDLVKDANFPEFDKYLRSSGLHNHTYLIRRLQSRLHDNCRDEMFESKKGFMEVVNKFVKEYDGLKPIDWTKVKFSKKLKD